MGQNGKNLNYHQNFLLTYKWGVLGWKICAFKKQKFCCFFIRVCFLNVPLSPFKNFPPFFFEEKKKGPPTSKRYEKKNFPSPRKNLLNLPPPPTKVFGFWRCKRPSTRVVVFCITGPNFVLWPGNTISSLSSRLTSSRSWDLERSGGVWDTVPNR